MHKLGVAMTNAPETVKPATRTGTPGTASGERSLLIVEDDKSFLQRLARAMEARGFVVATAQIGRRRSLAGRKSGARFRRGRHALGRR